MGTRAGRRSLQWARKAYWKIYHGGYGQSATKIARKKKWISESDEDRSKEEVEDLSEFPEGAKTRITVNRYERDRRNRKAAIAFHGIACLACNVRMAERYGEIADDFIHIHHTKSLSTGDEYTPDVKTDLIPLCPNCHAVVHLVNPPMTLEELRRRLAEVG